MKMKTLLLLSFAVLSLSSAVSLSDLVKIFSEMHDKEQSLQIIQKNATYEAITPDMSEAKETPIVESISVASPPKVTQIHEHDISVAPPSEVTPIHVAPPSDVTPIHVAPPSAVTQIPVQSIKLSNGQPIVGDQPKPMAISKPLQAVLNGFNQDLGSIKESIEKFVSGIPRADPEQGVQNAQAALDQKIKNHHELLTELQRVANDKALSANEFEAKLKELTSKRDKDMREFKKTLVNEAKTSELITSVYKNFLDTLYWKRKFALDRLEALKPSSPDKSIDQEIAYVREVIDYTRDEFIGHILESKNKSMEKIKDNESKFGAAFSKMSAELKTEHEKLEIVDGDEPKGLGQKTGSQEKQALKPLQAVLDGFNQGVSQMLKEYDEKFEPELLKISLEQKIKEIEAVLDEKVKICGDLLAKLKSPPSDADLSKKLRSELKGLLSKTKAESEKIIKTGETSLKSVLTKFKADMNSADRDCKEKKVPEKEAVAKRKVKAIGKFAPSETTNETTEGKVEDVLEKIEATKTDLIGTVLPKRKEALEAFIEKEKSELDTTFARIKQEFDDKIKQIDPDSLKSE